MVNIKVTEVVGNGLCISSEDGQRLFDLISNNFKEYHKVNLSFQDVKHLTSVFLNTSIGQLYASFSEEFIREYLSVSDIETDDAIVLKRVVDRAKNYFKNPRPYEKAIEVVIGGNNE